MTRLKALLYVASRNARSFEQTKRCSSIETCDNMRRAESEFPGTCTLLIFVAEIEALWLRRI